MRNPSKNEEDDESVTKNEANGDSTATDHDRVQSVVNKSASRFSDKEFSVSTNYTSDCYRRSIINVEDQVKTSKLVLQLVTDSSFNMTQINGQRKLGGPPPGWVGPPPGPGCEVFVGKLPRVLYEDEIYPTFRRMGEVYEIRLMMDFSGTNRGYCFVMYGKSEYATRAIKELDNFEIRPGRKIGVVASINNCKLFVGQLPPDISSETIIRKVYEITDDVGQVAVYRTVKNQAKYALISYKTHRGAAMARRRLVPERTTLFEGAEVSIDWAHPGIFPANIVEESGTLDEGGNVDISRLVLGSDTRRCQTRRRTRDEFLDHSIRTYLQAENLAWNKRSISIQESFDENHRSFQKYGNRFDKNRFNDESLVNSEQTSYTSHSDDLDVFEQVRSSIDRNSGSMGRGDNDLGLLSRCKNSSESSKICKKSNSLCESNAASYSSDSSGCSSQGSLSESSNNNNNVFGIFPNSGNGTSAFNISDPSTSLYSHSKNVVQENSILINSGVQTLTDSIDADQQTNNYDRVNRENFSVDVRSCSNSESVESSDYIERKIESLNLFDNYTFSTNLQENLNEVEDFGDNRAVGYGRRNGVFLKNSESVTATNTPHGVRSKEEKCRSERGDKSSHKNRRKYELKKKPEQKQRRIKNQGKHGDFEFSKVFGKSVVENRKQNSRRESRDNKPPRGRNGRSHNSSNSSATLRDYYALRNYSSPNLLTNDNRVHYPVSDPNLNKIVPQIRYSIDQLQSIYQDVDRRQFLDMNHQWQSSPVASVLPINSMINNNDLRYSNMVECNSFINQQNSRGIQDSLKNVRNDGNFLMQRQRIGNGANFGQPMIGYTRANNAVDNVTYSVPRFANNVDSNSKKAWLSAQMASNAHGNLSHENFNGSPMLFHPDRSNVANPVNGSIVYSQSQYTGDRPNVYAHPRVFVLKNRNSAIANHRLGQQTTFTRVPQPTANALPNENYFNVQQIMAPQSGRPILNRPHMRDGRGS
ncbi:uncharacterized protein LOC105693572 isoform X1 [Athalia rosae]|uniref:uncharacterized protein LOC105693572 isoform X1 n=1 Tax=Athalia rosae TaxID=37344 RepID=UPI0020344EBC|nr:uncharacterized protein LOC105693572 isoform X1 [Athalia rosae]